MGNLPLDLEALRQIFADRSSHIVVGKVIETDLASDRSILYAKCEILTQEREVVARVCWDAVGPSAGSFQFPQVDDLVLLEFAEGDHEQCYLTKRLSNKTDVIPSQASSGDMVHRALTGKKLHLCSDERINLGTGGVSQPTQPLVLGTELVALLTGIIDDILNAPAIGTCAVGAVALSPTIRAQWVALKAQYITTSATNILSQLAFTERG